jgi:type II secretory pathway component PulF
VATGPAKPFAGEETYWETDTPGAGMEPEWNPADLSLPRRPEGWRLRHLMYTIVIVAVLLWLFVLIGSLLLVGGFVVLVGVVIGGGVTLARRRATRQDSLLCVMAIAAEREMPLAPAMVAFADQYRGKSHRRIMDLAAHLNWGAMLPEALERVPKVVSRDALLLSWIGQATGKLPKALRLAATARMTQLPIWSAIAGRLTYIVVLLLAMQTISSFVLYFIIPRLEAIFRDFNLPLPQITVDTIMASHFIVKYFYLFFPIFLIEVVLLFYIPVSFLSGGNFDIFLNSPLDRLLRRRHAALIFRSLSLVVEAGQPISLGLSTLSNHYPTRWVRRKLLTVESDVQQGADWIESLLNQGLIRSADAEVLRSSTTVGNLAWVLAELAETSERRLAIRLQALIQLLFPLVVITLGFVVFLFAMAYFAPLVKLITELARV